MREVRTCDFCDEEATGTFEVVPPERDPAGDGRRMVLCPDCRTTLAGVLEPLLGGTAAGHGDGAVEERTTTVVAEPERDVTTESEASTGPAPGSVGEPDSSTDGEPDPSTDGEPGPSADGDSRTSGVSADENGEDDGEQAPGGRPRATRRGTPRGYRKVMRFLENREFPLDRAEAETLVVDAYEMDPDAVSAAIDHAVKHNRLREANGDLLQ